MYYLYYYREIYGDDIKDAVLLLSTVKDPISVASICSRTDLKTEDSNFVKLFDPKRTWHTLKSPGSNQT